MTAALNTINGLVDQLKMFLERVLVELPLEAVAGPRRPPMIVTGWLPPKRSEDEPQPPYLIIRPTKGRDDDDGARIEVQLCLETFSEDADGWQDLTNVVQRVRSALTETRTLGPFHLELPLHWQLFDEQPLPQWGALLTTTWTQPSMEWLGETE